MGRLKFVFGMGYLEQVLENYVINMNKVKKWGSMKNRVGN